MTNKKAQGKKFSVSVDAKRQQMLKELVEKVGVKQNGIINMAITKMHEMECPSNK